MFDKNKHPRLAEAIKPYGLGVATKHDYAKLDEAVSEVCNNLSYTESQLSRTKAEIEEAKKLLQVSLCPASCDMGAIPHQIGENEWEAEQCQFCYEREQLLSNQPNEPSEE